MNKAIDSEDDSNSVKRRPRTKADLAIVRPWQNQIMGRFLDILLQEAPNGYLLKSTLMRKYNESGVPITWPRLLSVRPLFEKKNNFPPWSLATKIAVVVPLRDPETNVQRVEERIAQIIHEKIDKEQAKFKLPIRIADIQKEY